MITRVSRNVICIKDIPSNLIEEAIFILKTNSNEEQTKTYTKRSKEFLMKEAEDIIIEYNDKFQNEYNRKRRIERANKTKLKKMKIKAISLAVIFVIGCIIIGTCIK